MITKEEVQKILEQFNISSLEKIGKVLKDDHVSYGVAVHTSKGKYFLKEYRLFGDHVKTGLKTIQFLQEKNYPTNKLILSKNKKAYITHEGRKISLFGFIEEKEKLNLNREQVAELGKYLGRLHSITKNKSLPKGKFDYHHFAKIIKSHYRERKRAKPHIQEIIEYMHKNIKLIKCKTDQPKAAQHVEFTPEHVRFKGNKLVHVIDWDIVNRDYCYYDLGTAMISCFTKKRLDFTRVDNLIKAYNKERKLTTWEKEHLFEALHYGCFKFCTWVLSDPKTGKLKLHYDWPEDIERVQMLIKMTKKEFQQKITI